MWIDSKLGSSTEENKPKTASNQLLFFVFVLFWTGGGQSGADDDDGVNKDGDGCIHTDRPRRHFLSVSIDFLFVSECFPICTPQNGGHSPKETFLWQQSGADTLLQGECRGRWQEPHWPAFWAWLFTLKEDVCAQRSPEAAQLNGSWRSSPISASRGPCPSVLFHGPLSPLPREIHSLRWWTCEKLSSIYPTFYLVSFLSSCKFWKTVIGFSCRQTKDFGKIRTRTEPDDSFSCKLA